MDEFDLMGTARARKELPKLSKQSDGVSRAEVVNAFHRAFNMVGGVPRLAMWANENPGDFFKLYGRLLPSTTAVIGEQAAPLIVHALRPTALDNHPGQVIDLQTGRIIPQEELEKRQA